MAFDAQGFRKAALQAGIPQNQVEQAIAQRTGVKGWLTGGKKGLGGVASGIGNVLNLPSYAIGGALNQLQRGVGSKYGQQTDATGLGILEGIKSKRGVMTEAPETLGIDPNSTAGKVLGFGAELLVPAPPIGKAFKFARGADKVSDASKAGLFARGLNKAGSTLEDVGKATPLRGLGRNKITEKLIGGLDRIGMTPEQFMNEFNLWGRDIDQVNDVLRGVDKAYKKASSVGDVSTQGLMRAFDDEILTLSKKAGQSRSAAAELNRLQEAREGFLKSIQQGGNTPYTPLRTQLSSVADAKSIVSEDIPQTYFNLGGAQKGAGKGAERARRIYKSTIDTATDGKTAQLGGKESALIDFRKLLNKQQTANMGNKNISFPKMIAPFGGYAFGGLPGAAATAGAEMFLNSPTGIKLQSRGLTGVGKALQNPLVTKGANLAQKGATQLGYTGARVSQMPNSGRTMQSQNPTGRIQPSTVKTPSYTKSIPQPVNIPVSTKKINYKAPENVFKNKSSFGKVKKLKAGSFN